MTHVYWKKYSLSEISDIIHGVTYRRSKKKFPKPLPIDYKIVIPVEILSDKRFSVFEVIVSYLKEKLGLRYSQIASYLHRDQRTIWTIYNRYKKKK